MSEKPPLLEPRVYKGKDIDVVDHGLCVHSRYCVTGNTKVFVPFKDGDWVFPDAARPDEVAALIRQCPSGSLTYQARGGLSPEKAPSVNIVRTTADGPLALRGEFYLPGETEPRFRLTLCRCGHSKKKPFCDGSHRLAEFKADGEPEAGDTAMLTKRDGPVQIKIQPNGPLLFKGNLEITTASGHPVWRGTSVQLCRCGQSDTKPICDGSHQLEGFETGANHAAPTELAASQRAHRARIFTHERKRVMDRLLDQYESESNMLAEYVFGGDRTQVPAREVVEGFLRKKREEAERAYGAGRTRLLVVPLETMERLSSAASDMIKEYRRNGNLYGSEGETRITEEPASGENVWITPALKAADTNGLLGYFPRSFSNSHAETKAVSKADYVGAQGKHLVLLAEDTPNLPLEGKGEKIGLTPEEGRPQITAGRSPEEYLDTLQHNDHYRGEIGYTPEIALIHFMARLFDGEKGRVMDDKVANYLIGTYLRAGDEVPYFRWDSDHCRIVIGVNSRDREHDFSARSAYLLGVL